MKRYLVRPLITLFFELLVVNVILLSETMLQTNLIQGHWDVSYNDRYKGNRCLFPPTRRVFITWHVLFDKHSFFFPHTYCSLQSQETTLFFRASHKSLFFLNPLIWASLMIFPLCYQHLFLIQIQIIPRLNLQILILQLSI